MERRVFKRLEPVVITKNESYGFLGWTFRLSGLKKSINITKRMCMKCGETF